VATQRRKQRNRKTRPANILAAERRRRAIDLRSQGKTFVEIGKELGISGPRAFQLVTEAMDGAHALLVTETARLRQKQLDRIEALVEAIWPAGAKGDVAKIDRIVKLFEREAKLGGLDASDKLEVTGKDGKPLEISSVRAQLVAKLQGLAAKGS
jgi:hypothetical protein